MKSKADNASDPITSVEKIFAGATPRPRAPDEHRQAVYEAVHAEWDDLAAKRRRRRQAGWGLLAASLVLGVAALFLGRAVDVTPIDVASVDRYSGTVMFATGEPRVWHRLRGAVPGLSGGTSIKTLDGRIGLLLDDGASLRVGKDTTVTLLAANAVRLDTGIVYFDSGPDSAGEVLRVETPWGIVRDIGTQFSVDSDEASLTLRVRSGLAEIGRKRKPTRRARAGEQWSIRSDGEHREDIEVSGADWAWAEQLAPGFDRNGRKVIEYLEWFAHETGLRFEFEDAAARRRAYDEKLSGDVVGPSREHLEPTLSTARLRVRIIEDTNTIVISTED